MQPRNVAPFQSAVIRNSLRFNRLSYETRSASIGRHTKLAPFQSTVISTEAKRSGETCSCRVRSPLSRFRDMGILRFTPALKFPGAPCLDSETWETSDLRHLKLRQTQHVPVRVFEPRNPRTAGSCPNTVRIIVVHSRKAQEINSSRTKTFNSFLNVFNAPTQHCKRIRMMFLHSRHPQHRAIRIEHQRERLLIRNQAQPQNILIERSALSLHRLSERTQSVRSHLESSPAPSPASAMIFR